MNAQSSRKIDRRLVMCSLASVAGIILALIRVPTYLGVKVEGTVGIGGIEFDKAGHERIWRVWWRARDDLFDVSPQWIFTSALIMLLVLFVTATLAAVWIAMSTNATDTYNESRLTHEST